MLDDVRFRSRPRTPFAPGARLLGPGRPRYLRLSAAGGQVASPPSPVAPVGTPGFANNAPASSQPTIADPDSYNSILQELAAVIVAGGGTVNPSLNNQVLTAIQALIAAGAGVQVRRVNGNATITGLTTDNYVGVVDAGGATIYDLPASPSEPLKITVYDASNLFGTHACTVKTTDGSTIEGRAGGGGFAMNAGGQKQSFLWDMVQWQLV